MARKKFIHLKYDDPFKEIFRSETEEHLKEVRDQRARDEYVYDEGHAAGITEGKEDNQWSLIQKKLAKGKTIAQIADELESTEEEILSIINKRQ